MPSVSKRYKVAEDYYKNLLTTLIPDDLLQVEVAARPGATQINTLPAFTLNWDNTQFVKMLNVQRSIVIKRLNFEGLLLCSSAGGLLGDARLVGQPIIEKIDTKLLGSTVDFTAYPEIQLYERVDPTATGRVAPVQLSTGGFALLIEWFFEMTFTKGVS
jgi:hypothetical protein